MKKPHLFVSVFVVACMLGIGLTLLLPATAAACSCDLGNPYGCISYYGQDGCSSPFPWSTYVCDGTNSPPCNPDPCACTWSGCTRVPCFGA